MKPSLLDRIVYKVDRWIKSYVAKKNRETCLSAKDEQMLKQKLSSVDREKWRAALWTNLPRKRAPRSALIPFSGKTK